MKSTTKHFVVVVVVSFIFSILPFANGTSFAQKDNWDKFAPDSFPANGLKTKRQTTTESASSTTVPNDFAAQLEAGEFSLALQAAHAQADQATRDQMLKQLALAQKSSATGLSSFDTASQIDNEQLRGQAFDLLTTYRRSSFDGNGFGGSSGGFGGDRGAGDVKPPFNRAGSGNGGGITEQDFEELMDLIQETIDPDSWEANGGNGRMRPYPSGVFVDASGTLRRIKKDKSGRLQKIREASAREMSDSGVLQQTELRQISLSRLARQLQRLAATGKEIPDDLKYLAGIYQLKYVMLYPETGDVVIAGPAGPWYYDELGRAINTKTKQPVLNLDDFVICLRNVRQAGGQFSCSIDPKTENLIAAKEFSTTTTLKGRAFRTKMQEVLGQMDVSIDGIEPNSHAARVIVEADYQMKLIGLGVAPSVSKLDNYFDRIHLDESGQLPAMDQLVRWWFTMNYDSVTTNEQRTIFELNGQGVKLLSESEFWSERGERVHTGISSPAAKGFADDFTRRFPEIAQDDPVFGQLKNVFDCALAASVIYREGLGRKVDWNLDFLQGENLGNLRYMPAVDQVPTKVDSILGQRILRKRVGGGSITHTISGFGGGVVFNSAEHTDSGKIKVAENKRLAAQHKKSMPKSSDRKDWNWD